MKGSPDGIVGYDTIRDKGLKLAAVSGSAQVGYAERTGIAAENILQLPDKPDGGRRIASRSCRRLRTFRAGCSRTRGRIAGADMEAGALFSTVAGEAAIAHGAFAFCKEDADIGDAFDKELTAFIGKPEQIAIMEAQGLTADELPQLKTSELCGE